MDLALANQLRLLAGDPPAAPSRAPARGGEGGHGGDDDKDGGATPPGGSSADAGSWLRPYALLSALIGGVIGAALIGQWLDRVQGTSPAWTLGLALPVLVACFWQLLRELRR